MNNLYFVSIKLIEELSDNPLWVVPSVLGSENKTFQKAEVKSALKYAKTICLEASIQTQNKVRYYPILMGQGRMIEGQKLTLSTPTRSRAGLENSTVYRQIFNIREKLAPDKNHRIYVGEIVVDGEIVDVYTDITTSSIVNRLPIIANAITWKEGAFARACDELDMYKPRPVPERGDWGWDNRTDEVSRPRSPFEGNIYRSQPTPQPESPTLQRITELIIEAFNEAAEQNNNPET